MASTIRGSDNFDSGVNTGLGYGQTWQNVLGSRSSGVVYTNSTGKPIMVIVSWGHPSAYNQCYAYVNEALIATGYAITPGGAQIAGGTTTIIVPNGSTYRFNYSVGYGWSELR